jgi:DNA-binding transcriptional MerR regulator
MKVTEFARRAGVGPEVVRYYVREGLLAPRRDPMNGYKRFDHPQLARIQFIRLAQALGFTLREIGDLLARMDAGGCPCADMRKQLGGKMVENRIKIRELQERQQLMERAYANWDRAALARAGTGQLCRLLDSIDALTTLD